MEPLVWNAPSRLDCCLYDSIPARKLAVLSMQSVLAVLR
jgi:hypothetical protein